MSEEHFVFKAVINLLVNSLLNYICFTEVNISIIKYEWAHHRDQLEIWYFVLITLRIDLTE